MQKFRTLTFNSLLGLSLAACSTVEDYDFGDASDRVKDRFEDFDFGDIESFDDIKDLAEDDDFRDRLKGAWDDIREKD